MEEEKTIKTAKAHEKSVRSISPKRKAAIEARKEEAGRKRVERYCRLYYSELLTLEEVAKLLECSIPVAIEMLRDTYFDIAEPNKNEERKDMEFRYAELYNKMHRK